MWQRGAGDNLDVFDPVDGEVLVSVESASIGQLSEALDAARGAQRSWARTPAPERGRLIRGVADLIDANSRILVEALVREVGKRRAEAEGRGCVL